MKSVVKQSIERAIDFPGKFYAMVGKMSLLEVMYGL